MIQHIEFIIEHDLATWGQDKEDFPIGEDEELLLDDIKSYYGDEYNIPELLEHLKIKKIWYEE